METHENKKKLPWNIKCINIEGPKPIPNIWCLLCKKFKISKVKYVINKILDSTITICFQKLNEYVN